tara:strand:+ start:2322 stop:2807 length:486 start_codon:yes stop_codon:yes gene_type:complete
MKKIYSLILSLFLIISINGCAGYKPLFNSSSLMINIKKHTIEGDQDLGKRIYLKLENLLKSKNKKDKKNINLILDISKNKQPTIKDKSGKIVEYKITLNTIIIVKKYETEKLILNKNISNSINYTVQDQYSQSMIKENKAIEDLINQTYQEVLVILIQNIS